MVVVKRSHKVTFYAGRAARDARSRRALRAAVKACGGRRRFAQLADVEERTVGRWLSGSRKVNATARVLVFVILADPSLIPLLEGAASAARGAA